MKTENSCEFVDLYIVVYILDEIKFSFTEFSFTEHMKKLEYEIKETLILAIVGKNYISDDTRRKFSLPARLGGLGFLDQC